jgi:hypothetical protein
VFTDGYPAFSLGVFSYLNQTNTMGWLPIVLYGIAVAAAIMAFVLLRRERRLVIFAVVGGAILLSLAVMLPVLSSVNPGATPPPALQRPIRTVGFDQQHSTVSFRVLPSASSDEDWEDYGTFFVWTQRIGIVPVLHVHLSDAVAEDGVVIINPSVSFSSVDVQKVTGFLQQGGRLLVIDSIRNPGSTANELLSSFGIWTRPVIINEITMPANDTAAMVNRSIPTLVITGGTPLRTDGQGNVVVAELTFKNSTGWPGKILVMVDSSMFSTAQMGSPFTEPTSQQREWYDMEFSLFDTLFS